MSMDVRTCKTCSFVYHLDGSDYCAQTMMGDCRTLYPVEKAYGNAKCKARIDALGKNPCKPDGSFYGYEEHAYYIKHAGFKKGDGHGTVTKKSLH